MEELSREEIDEKIKLEVTTNFYDARDYPNYKLVYRDTGEVVKEAYAVDLLSHGRMIVRKIEVTEDDKYMLLDDNLNEVKFKPWSKLIPVG